MRARAQGVEVALTKPSDKRTRNFIPRTNYGPPLHSFTSIHCRNVISRELCRDTCARTSLSQNSARRMDSRQVKIRDHAVPCPSIELRATLHFSILYYSFFFFSLELHSKITMLLIGNSEGRYFFQAPALCCISANCEVEVSLVVCDTCVEW